MTIKSLLTIIIALTSSALAFTLSADDGREPLPCLNKEFSIVAHIIIDSLGIPAATEEQIELSMERLNEDFSPICASFKICEFRYIENFQYSWLVFDEELGLPNTGNFEQTITEYHKANRINIFYVGQIDDGQFCGRATLGGITQMNMGGIYIKQGCLSNATTSHEMGHYFGLLHTFEESGLELADGSNCETAGDGICDTPADPYDEEDDISLYVDEDCRFIYQGLDANGDYYDPHVGNIMSYYPCECEFSYQQYLHMAELYLNSNPKMW